jgi:CheY-like chemotaxis protein
MKTERQGPFGLASQVTVLSVGPKEEDNGSLKTIFGSSEWNLCPNSKWRLKTRSTIESALALLRKSRISVVLCERDLLPGTWRDLLEQLAQLPDPPALVVTSRVADDSLWAEALNLGAYDVLSKPFDGEEVVRVVSLAWLSRDNPPQSAAGAFRGRHDLAPGITPQGPRQAWSTYANAAGGSNGLRHAV